MNENENVMPELTLDPKEVAAPTLTLEEDAAPSLSLEPTPVKNEMVLEKTENPIGVDDSMLSEAEKKQVDAFVKQIDIKDSNIVLQYGSGAQKKMAAFSEKAIENVKTKDMGEVGKLLSDVVIELKGFNDEEDKGLFGFFKKQGNKLQMLKTKYDKADVNIGKITDALESHQITLMKDTAMLDKMYELNLTHFKELTMYIIAGMDKKAILFSGMGISIASFAAVYFLNSGYSRTSRIQAFINPLKYRDSKSWQLIKSLFAITNGSLWGVGLGNGRQKYTLSEAHNDFIFATIAEEFGFIGSVFLIGVYIYLAYLGIMISRYIKNLYGKMIVLGITFSIGLQTLVNIGTATGTIPPTGVTLPFVSYGGSSLIMTSIMIGIILGIVRHDTKGR